jgi:hypothetical protein
MTPGRSVSSSRPFLMCDALSERVPRHECSLQVAAAEAYVILLIGAEYAELWCVVFDGNDYC